MNILIPTFIIFALCLIGLGIGLLFKRGPLKKRCSSDPEQECYCEDDTCERDIGK